MNILDPKEIKKYTYEVKEPTFRPLNEVLSDLVAMGATQGADGYFTPDWGHFNHYFGGIKSELVVITADTGQGKSTFARNWMRQMLLAYVPSALITLEESVEDALSHIVQMETGVNKLSEGPKLVEVNSKFEQYPGWYLDHYGRIDAKFLINAIIYGSREKGIKFFVIDHLDYINKSHEWSNNESYVIGDFMRELATVSHREKVAIVLVVHPAKLEKKGEGSRPVGLDELKGSSSIKQEADAVFGIYRPDKNSTLVHLRFLKIRKRIFSKNMGGKLSFDLNPETYVLEERNEPINFD